MCISAPRQQRPAPPPPPNPFIPPELGNAGDSQLKRKKLGKSLLQIPLTGGNTGGTGLGIPVPTDSMGIRG